MHTCQGSDIASLIAVFEVQNSLESTDLRNQISQLSLLRLSVSRHLLLSEL